MSFKDGANWNAFSLCKPRSPVVERTHSLLGSILKYVIAISTITIAVFVICSLLTPPLLRGNAGYYVQIDNKGNEDYRVVPYLVVNSLEASAFDPIIVASGTTVKVATFSGFSNGPNDSIYRFDLVSVDGRVRNSISLTRPDILRALPRAFLPFKISKEGRLIFNVQ